MPGLSGNRVKILTTSNKSVFASEGSGQDSSWRQLMNSAIRSGKDLLRAVQLDNSPISLAAAEGDFPVFVPVPFLERIEKSNVQDPLLRQVLPLADEDQTRAGFSVDPICESDAVLADGVLQKYRGRVLVIAAGACAINCRYCFRRFFPYEMAPRGDESWIKSALQIEGDPSVNEVILSGGDPLTLVDEKLSFICHRLASIAHVKRIRIHSRLPVVIPQRVTEGLLQTLQEIQIQHGVQVVFVIHSNHPNEIDDRVAESLSGLRMAVNQLLNQSVLLAGVNDDAAALIGLSEKLLAAGVLPYYLHQLDRVRGTAHFEVDVQRGKSLIDEMRSVLPGYAVPRLVKEYPGEPGKTVIA